MKGKIYWSELPFHLAFLFLPQQSFLDLKQGVEDECFNSFSTFKVLEFLGIKDLASTLLSSSLSRPKFAQRQFFFGEKSNIKRNQIFYEKKSSRKHLRIYFLFCIWTVLCITLKNVPGILFFLVLEIFEK